MGVDLDCVYRLLGRKVGREYDANEKWCVCVGEEEEEEEGEEVRPCLRGDLRVVQRHDSLPYGLPESLRLERTPGEEDRGGRARERGRHSEAEGGLRTLLGGEYEVRAR